MTAYGSTKLMNLLFCFEGDRRLRAARSTASIRAAHPGNARSELGANGVAAGRPGPISAVVAFATDKLAQSHRARRPAHAARRDRIPRSRPGASWGPRGPSRCSAIPCRSRPPSRRPTASSRPQSSTPRLEAVSASWPVLGIASAQAAASASRSSRKPHHAAAEASAPALTCSSSRPSRARSVQAACSCSTVRVQRPEGPPRRVDAVVLDQARCPWSRRPRRPGARSRPAPRGPAPGRRWRRPGRSRRPGRPWPARSLLDRVLPRRRRSGRRARGGSARPPSSSARLAATSSAASPSSWAPRLARKPGSWASK